MTPLTLDAPPKAVPVVEPTPVIERTNLQVTPEQLAEMKRGVDYTGKLEVTGRGTYVWHRDRPGEMKLAQEALARAMAFGATVFDVTGGLDHAEKIRSVNPDTEELIGVAPIVGG